MKDITQEIIEKFREKFVRHPAEIKGTKRVEWKQLATDRVDEAEQWLLTSLTEILKADNQTNTKA